MTPAQAASKRRWYDKNAERIKANMRRRYAEEPGFKEAAQERSVIAYQENKERQKESSRKSALKNKYGITPEQFNEMDKAQGGVCFICKRRPEVVDPKKKRLCVDHNHETGQVRALLCHSCNIGLGSFSDSAATLYRAIEYLNSFSKEQQ